MSFSDSAFGFTFAEANVGYGKFNDPNAHWNKLQQGLYQKITTMATELPLIEKLIKKIGTSEETRDHKDQILNGLNKMRSLANEISVSLKEISVMLNDTKDKRLSQERKLIVERITRDFKGWLKIFNEVSESWISAEKKLNAEAKKSTNYGNRILNFFSSGKRDEEKIPLQQQQQQQVLFLDNELDYYDAVILEREKGIREVEKNILEVNEIYLDLSSLISTQGEMIDSIENHIESARDEVTVGVGHLESAVEHQKSANSKVYLIALICAMLIILICGLVFIVVKVIP